MYVLLKSEVLNSKMSWSEKFEGQVEKMAYNLANKDKSGNHDHGGNRSGADKSSGKFKIVACKDWNWKENCAYSEEACNYEHVCFECLKQGSISKEHKAKECSHGANQRAAPSAPLMYLTNSICGQAR